MPAGEQSKMSRRRLLLVDGVVTLEGTSPQPRCARAAERRTSEVAGVRAIENRIRLRRGADEE
jgi:osmotically-inducible protein OsmY